MEFKSGETYRARLDGYRYSRKIHITHILDSHYGDQKLIVFKFYGKFKQWWWELMDTDENLENQIKRASKDAKYENTTQKFIPKNNV